MNYSLPEKLRAELKEPLGEVLSEPDWDGTFITVGDECSYFAAKAGKKPMLMVYDHLIKRKVICDEKMDALEAMPGKKIVAENPAGTITEEAELAIKLALESIPSKVQITGEEDLLVLPCLIHAPEGTTLYYGQPNKGVVKVIVNTKSRKRAKKILLLMEEVK